jgi:2-C-methyl-D-erythritol 2,4-cyclodiphosphate synthase
MNVRVGQGFDLHCLVPGRALILGGVKISWQLGLAGHSDADALLHAIIDAVLGALALGDIGNWFPDTDNAWKDADSAQLLRKVLTSPEVQGWQIANLDCTVIAEKPKLASYALAIRQSIANICQCELEQISFKAKTNEGQDAIGQGKALAAQAIVLMMKKEG